MSGECPGGAIGLCIWVFVTFMFDGITKHISFETA